MKLQQPRLNWHPEHRDMQQTDMNFDLYYGRLGHMALKIVGYSRANTPFQLRSKARAFTELELMNIVDMGHDKAAVKDRQASPIENPRPITVHGGLAKVCCVWGPRPV